MTKHLPAKAAATLAITFALATVAAPTANAQPAFVPEPTPALQVGPFGVSLCATLPLWPFPFVGISVCI